MALETAKSGLVLPNEEVAKLTGNNKSFNGSLVTETVGWGPVRLSIVLGNKKVPIEASTGTEERWVTSLPQETVYSAYSLKDSRMYFQLPKILSGNVRTIGLSPLIPTEGGMTVSNDFIRFSALAKYDQSAAMGNFMTPKEERSKLVLALVEMEESMHAVFGEALEAEQRRTREQLVLPPMPSINVKTVKNVLGIFEIGIEPVMPTPTLS